MSAGQDHRADGSDRGRPGAAAGRIAVPDDLVWRRMHPITPVLTGWKMITAIVAFATIQNIEAFLSVWEAIREEGATITLPVALAAVGGTLGVLVLVGVVLYLNWRHRTYAVGADAVYLRWGIFFKQLRIARLPRIQSLDIVHPLLGRVFGLGQLTVEVAGGGDSRVVLGYMRTAELTALRKRILDLASGATARDDRSGDGLAGEPELADATTDGPRSSPAPTGHDAAARLDAPADGREAGVAGGPVASGPTTSGLRPAAVGAPGAVPGDVSGGHEAGERPEPGTVRRAPLGFEDAVAGQRLRSLETEEHPLYAVKVPVVLGSMLRSFSVVLSVGLVLVFAVGVIVSIVTGEGGLDGTATLTAVLSALAGPLALLGIGWSRFNGSWGFRAAATPAGIRLRYGLTSEASVTLPPGRVHAVLLTRPLLWAGKDWWRAEATVAGRNELESSSSGSISLDVGNVLLPVGERETALRALWLVVPDLGVPDPDAVLTEALSGTGRDKAEAPGPLPVDDPRRGFVGPPRRARIFSPLAWRRTGVMLTDTCVIIRQGRWSLRTSVIPYERIQSLRTSAGPLARRFGLAKLRLDMVTLQENTAVASLSQEDAAALADVIAERALRRRTEEKLDRWLARATSSPVPHETMPA
ncbi:MAG: PH domain-containing protein [Actinomyces sp.]|uniref:PH domain-containing protein n=1 Tax=Actinomyces sp. TaxID=29317 RepID=UPI0026DBF4CE|nr:PH domain-containing protein [Actinomyces sp.]MDO4244274.1 PH domain-containing protein [Actinomyces sp.]